MREIEVKMNKLKSKKKSWNVIKFNEYINNNIMNKFI